MKKAFSVLAGLASLISARPAEPSDYAWWLTARVAPAGESVAGIPLDQLNPLWVHAAALSSADVPSEGRLPGESPADHGATFTLLADVAGDADLERVLVGVYEDTSGAQGRFLLVLQRDGQRWSKKALFQADGVPGFSFLSLSDGTLLWSECLECDVFCALQAAGSELELACEACEECA